MPRRRLARITQVLVIALILGIPCGAALGALDVLPYRETRDVLWPLLSDSVQRTVGWAILSISLWLVIERIARSSLLATLLSLGPPALYVAYEISRRALPAVSSVRGFAANAVLVAGLVLVGFVVHRQLRRFCERGWETGHTPVVALVGLAAIPAVLHVKGNAGRQTGPNVVVILIDILRADHLGCYGYERPTSPNIDRFAEEAVLFENAISSATFTKTSVASLFTGLYPHRHGVYEGTLRDAERFTSDVLASSETTLAESLFDLGFHTEAWVANGQLRGYMGFDQGFARYRDEPSSVETISDEFRDWAGDWAHRSRWFAYLHLLDLHGPYNPPAPYRGRFGPETAASRDLDHETWKTFKAEVNGGELVLSDEDLFALEARHDEQLLHVDEWVGRILDDLRASGRWDDTLVVITSDHGEAFWEHGFIAHSKPPYDEVVHVPLIVKLPGSRQAGRRVERMVGLVDVAPTLIELAGGNAARDIDGESFAGVLVDVELELEPRTRFMEHRYHMGLRTERWKFIRRADGTLELYDLSVDPGERVDCAEQHPDVLASFQAACDRAFEQRRMLESGERVEVDDETLAQLQGLGYL